MDVFLAQKLAEDHLLANEAIVSADDDLLTGEAAIKNKVCLRTGGCVLEMVKPNSSLQTETLRTPAELCVRTK
jgi:hypothetical protein